MKRSRQGDRDDAPRYEDFDQRGPRRASGHEVDRPHDRNARSHRGSRREEGAYTGRAGRYEERPYASREPDYNYDPRGAGEYGYSAARGAPVNPSWDHYRGEIGGGAGGSDYGYGTRDRPASGRESASRTPGPDYPGDGGPRYGGADYGRGPQRVGRTRYDHDDEWTRSRMDQWSGARTDGDYEAYGPYGGSRRVDEGRSGGRSSWGGSDAQMASAGRFRGHGPQGYARSDERLTEDICERLTDDPDIDPRDVRVEVREGVVTLTGRVDERWIKHRIEDTVDACRGVKDVENRIRVGASDSGAGSAGKSESGGNPESARASRGGGSKSRH